MRLRIATVLAATAIHAVFFALAASPVFFRPVVAVSQRVFGGSNGERSLFEDVRAYHEYASRTFGGEVPYRDFTVEYPIAAMPLFLAPRAVASGEVPFRWAFGVEMLLFDAAILFLIADRRAILWYSAGLMLLGPLPIARFDLAATALAFGALRALTSGRAHLGGFLAALGGLMKLFPAVVIGPGLMIRAKRFVTASAFGVTAVAGVALWWMVGREGLFRSVGYHAGRGLEIESLYAGFLIVAAKVGGWALGCDYNHSSIELFAPGAALFAKLATPIQLLMVGLALFEAGGAGVPRCRAGLSAVLAFALFGKVLSPQYLIWLLPFAAALEDRSGRIVRPLILAACGLTTLLYFFAGVGLVMFRPLAVAILVVRNLTLLVAFAATIRR